MAPDPLPVLAAHLDAVGRYPDVTRATAAMAEVLGASPSQVLLTNGGAEAIALVAAHFPVGSVAAPAFALYERHLARNSPDGPVWRTNPSSPLGVIADAADRAAVWDEAFYQLVAGRWTRGDAADGAIVIGSLTKLLACPGLRVGYVLARDEALIGRLAERQPRWSVNGLVCEALPALLETADLTGWQRRTAALRSELVALLTRHGYTCRPGVANWVLIDAPGLRERLIPHGVVIRDCASFGLAGVMRVAVTNADGLARLDAALAAVRN